MGILGVDLNKTDLTMDEKFKKRLSKQQIFSIPNLLSLVRFLLIPVFVILYCKYEQYILATIVIVLSAITDVVDGFIARRFNMITDLGKFLDPVADKCTQVAMVICIATKNWWVIFLLVFMFMREIVLFVCGLLFFKKHDKVNSARWYGKLSTVVFFFTMFFLFIFPNAEKTTVIILLALCASVVLLSAILYAVWYTKLFREHNSKKE